MDKSLEKLYGLKRNPFLDARAQNEHLNFWVNREEEIEKWRRSIESSQTSNKNHFVIIIGSYGRGKSLSLFKIIDLVYKDYNKIFPVYMNFLDESKIKPAIDVINRIFKNIKFDFIKKHTNEIQLKNAINSLPAILKEPKNVFTKLFFNEIDSNTTQAKLFWSNNSIPNRTKDINNTALDFLTGEIIPTKGNLKELGIQKKINSSEIAKEYLISLLWILKRIGYNTLLLAIDEFEYLFSLVSRSQQGKYIALLRGLHDLPVGIGQQSIKPDEIANMLFFISISEDGWNSMMEMEIREKSTGGPTVPFKERIDYIIELPRFNKAYTMELIKKRLSFDRIKGRFQDQPLIPFTHDYVDYIYEISEGEPRKIIRYCRLTLEEGLARKIKLLDRKIAVSVIESRFFTF